MTVGRITNLTPPSDPWEALERICKPVAIEPKKPHEFTLSMYCSKYGRKRCKAQAEIDNYVAGGILRVRSTVVDGRRTRVYWMTPETEPRSKSRGKK
jgi:hypothetical protein